jgi:hypothetical protein
VLIGKLHGHFVELYQPAVPAAVDLETIRHLVSGW